MAMRRRGLLVAGAALVGAVAVVAAVGAQQQERRRRAGRDGREGEGFGFEIRANSDVRPVTSCSQFDARVRDGELARDEETRTLAAPAQGLQVSAAKNGAVFVSGSDRADYQVTLCKFTAGDTADEAQGRLSELSLSDEGGRVSVTGPTRHAYMAYLLVEAPRQAHLGVDVTNGPLDMRSLSGTISARTLNGPLTVRDVSGDVDLTATNGPVSVSRGSGRMRVNVQNGPLALNLSGTDWNGPGLDASAKNGPLHLGLPEGYRSGVLVDISGYGPFSCSSSVCRGAQRDWDDHARRLRFGNAQGDPIVRVSASNGPVSIGTAGSGWGKDW